MTQDQIETIHVVGGGDAGLMASLIVERIVEDVDIAIIDDFDQPIPRVGKSTTSYIKNIIHDTMDIDRSEFMNEVNPVWKASVYFKDWCGKEPFHIPFDDVTLIPDRAGSERFFELYHRYQTGNYRTIGTEMVAQCRSPFHETPQGVNFYPRVAYHLSTSRFNQYLRTLAKDRGISLINDRISDVEVQDGYISSVEGKDGSYSADLFMDATGFERVLMKNMNQSFTEFDIPLDSALVNNKAVNLSDIVPATVVTSGSAGWFWQIDTMSGRDLGYVYSSTHLSEEEAREEFIHERDELSSSDEFTRYEFESGILDTAWVNNCVAVGNALGFVEPLQSTALTTNGILMEKFAELLADHNRINHDGIRSIYNHFVESVWDNLFYFIRSHYRFAPPKNEFWSDIREAAHGEGVEQYVRWYNENGFVSHSEYDWRTGTRDKIFPQWLFYRLFRCMDVRSEFYENTDITVPDSVKSRISQQDENFHTTVDGYMPYTRVYGRVER